MGWTHYCLACDGGRLPGPQAEGREVSGRKPEEDKMDSDREVNSGGEITFWPLSCKDRVQQGLCPPAGMAGTSGAHTHRLNTPRTARSSLPNIHQSVLQS